MLAITAEQRRALRARAHPLHPLVAISLNGLTDAVLREISCSLEAHELVKIRVFNDEREQREAWLTEICEKLDAAPVQHIGKLLVVFRPAQKASAEEKGRAGKMLTTNSRRSTRSTRPGVRPTKRSFQN